MRGARGGSYRAKVIKASGAITRASSWVGWGRNANAWKAKMEAKRITWSRVDRKRKLLFDASGEGRGSGSQYAKMAVMIDRKWVLEACAAGKGAGIRA